MNFTNYTGWNLVEKEPEVWVLYKILDDGSYKEVMCGTFLEVVVSAIIEYNFNIGEIEYAVQEMCKSNHDSANFGRYKTLIYTYNQRATHLRAS